MSYRYIYSSNTETSESSDDAPTIHRRTNCYNNQVTAMSRYNKLPCDVTLNINEGALELDVDSFILSTKSNEFARIIEDAKAIALDEKVIINLKESEESLEVFELFIDLMYSGNRQFRREYILPLRTLALKYQVVELLHSCDDRIFQILQSTMYAKDERWDRYLDIALGFYMCENKPRNITDLILQTLCLRIKDLIESKKWETCPGKLISDLLKSDACNADENYILTAATNWMKSNHLRDKAQIQDILTNIRYPLLPRRVLYHLQKNNAFKNFPIVQELMTDAIRYHCFRDVSEALNDFSSKQFQSRSAHRPPSYEHINTLPIIVDLV